MNWLTNFVPPKLRALVSKRESPENLWEKCPSCGQMVFHRDLQANHRVCPQCDYHFRLSPDERLAQLFDDGLYDRIAVPEVATDPLKFRDSKKYADRLKESRAKTEEHEAMVVSVGRLGGVEAVIAAQNFGFMGGSMGLAVGEALIKSAEEAVSRSAPLIVIAAAGGARMQEGILSLMQMPRSTIAVDDVREAGLPLHLDFDGPDHWRRHRVLRHAWGYFNCGTRRIDRLRRAARHREHDSRKSARGISEGGVSARTRHARSRRSSPGFTRNVNPPAGIAVQRRDCGRTPGTG